MRNPCLYFAASIVAAGLFVGGCEKPAPAPATTGTPTNSAAPDLSKVQPMLQKVTDDIKNKDYKAADTDLKPLEDMKATLTPEIRTQVDQLRKSITAAKMMPTTVPSFGH